MTSPVRGDAGGGVARRTSRRRRDRRRAHRGSQPDRSTGRDHPHRLADNSSYLNFPGDSQIVRYGEGLFVGYRGYDATGADVAFPFGFGLSYTSFELSELEPTITGAAAENTLSATVAVTVTNTGPVAGAEVVQVYVRDLETSVARPIREL